MVLAGKSIEAHGEKTEDHEGKKLHFLFQF